MAAAGNRIVIIVDSSKPVDMLGAAKLPVEVLPFAAAFVERRLSEFGGRVELRAGAGGAAFVTDERNRIYDCHLGIIADPEALAARLQAILGVIGHGLFVREIDAVVIAQGGGVRLVERK